MVSVAGTSGDEEGGIVVELNALAWKVKGGVETSVSVAGG